MEQHPVPQQITSYQFRLVGDMTLKQFFQVGGGALVSLMIYALKIPGIIKWPLMIFFGAFGAALAFLPYQDRPLEQWLIAFFKAIYSPTKFSWLESGRHLTYFKSEPPQGMASQASNKPTNEVVKDQPTHPALLSLDEAEESFLTKISRLFKAGLSPTQPSQPESSQTTQVMPPPVQTQKIKIPDAAPAQIVAPQTKPRMVVEEQGAGGVKPQTTAVGQTLVGQMLSNLESVQFSPEAAPPSPPTIANTISGQVMDPEGKIVEAAILEIKDSGGRPVRALRSNKAGHFLIVTALANGKYQLLTEKEGLAFDPVSFEASGQIIPPIAVRAKEKVEKPQTN